MQRAFEWKESIILLRGIWVAALCEWLAKGKG
jgi:hypothetical protein